MWIVLAVVAGIDRADGDSSFVARLHLAVPLHGSATLVWKFADEPQIIIGRCVHVIPSRVAMTAMQTASTASARIANNPNHS